MGLIENHWICQGRNLETKNWNIFWNIGDVEVLFYKNIFLIKIHKKLGTNKALSGTELYE